MAVMLLAAVLTTLILGSTLQDDVPFSEKFVKARVNTIAPAIKSALMVGVIVGIHALIYEERVLVFGLGAILLGAIVALWNDGIRAVLKLNKTVRTIGIVMAVALIAALVGIYYSVIGNYMVSTIVDNTFDSLPEGYYTASEVAAKVRVGGDHLVIHSGSQGLSMRTCFYTDEGLAVAAAHGFDLGEGGYRMQLNGQFTLRAQVTEVTPSGIVLNGLVPPEESSHLGFALPSEITLGEEATLLHADEDIQVLLLGYHEAKGDQVLVVKQLDGASPIGPGFSGSPIVQNDKLIGFLSMAIKPNIMYRGPRIGFARLATEVYLETIGSRAPLPDTYDPEHWAIRLDGAYASMHAARLNDIFTRDRLAFVKQLAGLPQEQRKLVGTYLAGHYADSLAWASAWEETEKLLATPDLSALERETIMEVLEELRQVGP